MHFLPFAQKMGSRPQKIYANFHLTKQPALWYTKISARWRSEAPATAPRKIKNGEPFSSPFTMFYHSVLLSLGYLSAQSLGQRSPTIFNFFWRFESVSACLNIGHRYLAFLYSLSRGSVGCSICKRSFPSSPCLVSEDSDLDRPLFPYLVIVLYSFCSCLSSTLFNFFQAVGGHPTKGDRSNR